MDEQEQDSLDTTKTDYFEAAEQYQPESEEPYQPESVKPYQPESEGPHQSESEEPYQPEAADSCQPEATEPYKPVAAQLEQYGAQTSEQPSDEKASQSPAQDPSSFVRLSFFDSLQVPAYNASTTAADDVHPSASDLVQSSEFDPARNASVDAVQLFAFDSFIDASYDGVQSSKSDLHLSEYQTLTPSSDLHPTVFKPHYPTSDPLPSTSDLQPLTFDPHLSLCDPHSSTADPHPSTSDLQPSTSDLQSLTSDLHPSISDHHPSTPDLQPLTSDPHAYTSDPHPSTSDAHPSTYDPHPSTSDPNPSACDPHPFKSNRFPAISSSSTRQPSPLEYQLQLQALVRQRLQNPEAESPNLSKTRAQLFAALPEDQLRCLERRIPRDPSDYVDKLLVQSELNKRLLRQRAASIAQQTVGSAPAEPILVFSRPGSSSGPCYQHGSLEPSGPEGLSETSKDLSVVPMLILSPQGRPRPSSANGRLQPREQLQVHLGASLSTQELPRMVDGRPFSITEPSQSSGNNLVAQQTGFQESGEEAREVDQPPSRQNTQPRSRDPQEQHRPSSKQPQSLATQAQQSASSTKPNRSQEHEPGAKSAARSSSVPRRQTHRQAQRQQNAPSEQRTDMSSQLLREQAYRSHLIKKAYLVEQEAHCVNFPLSQLEEIAEAMEQQGGPTRILAKTTIRDILPKENASQVLSQSPLANEQSLTVQTSQVPPQLQNVVLQQNNAPPRVGAQRPPHHCAKGGVGIKELQSIVPVQSIVFKDRGVASQPGTVPLLTSATSAAQHVYILVRPSVSEDQGSIISQPSAVSLQPSSQNSAQNMVVVNTDDSQGTAPRSSNIAVLQQSTPISAQSTVLVQPAVSQSSTLSFQPTVRSSAQSRGNRRHYMVPIIKEPCAPASNTVISSGSSSPAVLVNSLPIVLSGSPQNQSSPSLVPSNSRTPVIFPNDASPKSVQPSTLLGSYHHPCNSMEGGVSLKGLAQDPPIQLQVASTTEQAPDVVLNSASQTQVAPSLPGIPVLVQPPLTAVLPSASVPGGVRILPKQASLPPLPQSQGSSCAGSQSEKQITKSVRKELPQLPKSMGRGQPPKTNAAQTGSSHSAQNKKKDTRDDASSAGKPQRSSRKQSFRGIRFEEPDFETVVIDLPESDADGKLTSYADALNQDAVSEPLESEFNRLTTEDILKMLNTCGSEDTGVINTPDQDTADAVPGPSGASSFGANAGQSVEPPTAYDMMSIQTPRPPDPTDDDFLYLDTHDDTSLDQFFSTPYNYEDDCDDFGEPDLLSALKRPDRDPFLSSTADYSESIADFHSLQFSSDQPSTTGRTAGFTSADVTTQVFRSLEHFIESVGGEPFPPLSSSVQVINTDPAKGRDVGRTDGKISLRIQPRTSNPGVVHVGEGISRSVGQIPPLQGAPDEIFHQRVHLSTFSSSRRVDEHSGKKCQKRQVNEYPNTPMSTESHLTSHSVELHAECEPGIASSSCQGTAVRASDKVLHDSVLPSNSAAAVTVSTEKKQNSSTVKGVSLTSKLTKAPSIAKSPEESAANLQPESSSAVNNASVQTSATDGLKFGKRRVQSASPYPGNSCGSNRDSAKSRKVSSSRTRSKHRSTFNILSKNCRSASRHRSEGKGSSNTRILPQRRRSEEKDPDSPHVKSVKSSGSYDASFGDYVRRWAPDHEASENPSPSATAQQAGNRQRGSTQKVSPTQRLCADKNSVSVSARNRSEKRVQTQTREASENAFSDTNLSTGAVEMFNDPSTIRSLQARTSEVPSCYYITHTSKTGGAEEKGTEEVSTEESVHKSPFLVQINTRPASIQSQSTSDTVSTQVLGYVRPSLYLGGLMVSQDTRSGSLQLPQDTGFYESDVLPSQNENANLPEPATRTSVAALEENANLEENASRQDPTFGPAWAADEKNKFRQKATSKVRKKNPHIARLLKQNSSTRTDSQNTDPPNTDSASEDLDTRCSDISKKIDNNRRESDSDPDDRDGLKGSTGIRRSTRLRPQETRSRDRTKRSNTSGNIKKAKERGSKR